MLNDLKLNYLQYTILVTIPSLMIILTTRFWGRMCDRIGYVIPMRLFGNNCCGITAGMGADAELLAPGGGANVRGDGLGRDGHGQL